MKTLPEKIETWLVERLGRGPGRMIDFLMVLQCDEKLIRPGLEGERLVRKALESLKRRGIVSFDRKAGNSWVLVK